MLLAIYLTDVAPRHAREDETKQRVLTLDAWWAERTLADVNGANCRAYVEHRTRATMEVRQAGEDWRHAAYGDRRGGAARTRRSARGDQSPPPGRSLLRDRLGRATAAEPARASGGLRESRRRACSGPPGEPRQVMRDKDTLRAVGRHVARFILVGLYTGTRSSRDLRRRVRCRRSAAAMSTLSRACSIAARSGAGRPRSVSRR